MQAQNLSETSDFKLISYERTTVKVALTELARLIQSKGIELDLPITLTQKMQKDLGKNLEQLSVEVEKTQTWRLTAKNQEDSDKDE